MQITTASTTVRGATLWHREAGSGYPVVLLHGGGGTGKAFAHQLEGLASRYRVIAPDLPGFGRSDWVPGVERVDELWPVLLEWMEALDIRRWALGGNSMGGRVALAAAIGAPDRISHLVLLDAVGVVIPELPPQNPLLIPADRYMSSLVYDPDHYRRITPYRTLEDAQELNRGRASFARYLAGSAIGPDRGPELHRAAMPTLLIWGRHDQIVPLAYGRALAAQMPQAELVVLENTGHLPHIEAAELVTHLIADFLDRHPVSAV